MTKVLVTYLSQTGNTKKIAETIFTSLENEEKEILPIEEIKEINQYNLLFIGFPVHSHSVPLKVQNLIRKLPAGKKVAFFSTHGSLAGSRLSREALEHAVTLASQAKVLGTFSCRGKISMRALDILRKSPEHKAWTEMAPSASSHPDEGDIEDAMAFAKWIKSLSAQRSL